MTTGKFVGSQPTAEVRTVPEELFTIIYVYKYIRLQTARHIKEIHKAVSDSYRVYLSALHHEAETLI